MESKAANPKIEEESGNPSIIWWGLCSWPSSWLANHSRYLTDILWCLFCSVIVIFQLIKLFYWLKILTLKIKKLFALLKFEKRMQCSCKLVFLGTTKNNSQNQIGQSAGKVLYNSIIIFSHYFIKMKQKYFFKIIKF